MTPENQIQLGEPAASSDPTARARARLKERSTTNITAQFHEEYFRTRFVYDPRRDGIWREVTRYIQKLYIKESDRVLDLGAGYCDFINHVVAAERHAVDIFTKLPKYAREGVQVHNHTCTNLADFATHSMDVVFASNLFEHLTHPELLETLDEIRRVLRPKGRLILLQPNFKYCYRTYFDDYTHLQVFTHMGMYDLLEMAGLRVEKMHAKFLPVNMKSTLRLRIPCLPLVVRAYLRSPWKPRAGQMLAVATNESPVYVEP